MEITFFDIKERREENFFKKKLKGHKLKFFKESIQNVPTFKFKDSQIVVVFIHSNFNSSIIDKLPKLKLILTQSTGFDHINLEYANQKGILIGNVPFYGENTVAEHTFSLILNLSRKVHKSYLRTNNNDFSINGLRGFDLKDKTLGIIGVGHIGLHVIRIAKGFGMKVKAFDLKPNDFLSEVLHYNYSSIDEILETSDIISLHMPLNKNTFHFLDEEKIKKTKKGVYIINTSRGQLIDTNCLYKYLKNSHIGGVGLDVIEGEELISHEDEILTHSSFQKDVSQIFLDHKIFSMDNVIFTPHNAFNSVEAILRINNTTLNNILEFVKKKSISNKI